MIEAWLILAVALTVLYLIATLRDGRGTAKTPFLTSALIAAPIAAAVAIALWYAMATVVYSIVVIEAQ
jgi:hypothetical protein